MAIYVVLEPENVAAPAKAERAVLIRDGFSFLAFLAPLIWLLWHRMWLEALAVLAASLALAALGMIPGYGALSVLLSLLLSLFIGLEAQGMRVAALGRRGWTSWGVVEGRNRSEAELLYASEAETTVVQKPAATSPSIPPAARPTSGPRTTGTQFGLLDYPQGS